MSSCKATAIRFSEHARKRMGQRGISEDEVDRCLDLGVSCPADKKGRAEVELGTTSIVLSDSMVVTAIKHESATIECSPELAGELLAPDGCIRSIQQQLPIICEYNEGKIHLKGDEKNVERASKRLHAKILAVKDNVRLHEVRVHATKNVVGHIIGKGGKNIRSLKQKTSIGWIDVRWDKAAREIVFLTKVPISAASKQKMIDFFHKVVPESK